MNELQIFQSPEFGRVRTVSIDGEPWFVGKDIALALGYCNTKDALSRHVDADDKGGVANHDPLRRARHDRHQRIWPLQPRTF